ncbi:MAG: 16S rRNA (guanine(527)-N(7))-methyltransferase RsmG [Mycoplasma sp.]|nr:16S rRNA (guanine(527)-N(7))-methyltransferase RsmG [Mycoplasma sp.]
MSFRNKTIKLVEEISNTLKIENNFSKLEKYVSLIEVERQKFNLTSFTGDKLWEEGIYYSILPLWSFFKNKGNLSQLTLADIGTGVGFPSIPFAIITGINVTGIDSNTKRMLFLNKVSTEINANNISTLIARVEEIKTQFDFVTARAVSKYKVLVEISHPILKMNGEVLFLKGPKVVQEIEDAEWISKELNITTKIINIKDIEQKDVNLLVYKKQNETPKKYPRNWKYIIK